MSDRKYMVFVEPKLFRPNAAEVFVFRDFDCPSCNGNGYIEFHIGYHGSDKEKDREPCQRCEGTGKLMMDVVVREKPNEPKIE